MFTWTLLERRLNNRVIVPIIIKSCLEFFHLSLKAWQMEKFNRFSFILLKTWRLKKNNTRNIHFQLYVSCINNSYNLHNRNPSSSMWWITRSLLMLLLIPVHAPEKNQMYISLKFALHFHFSKISLEFKEMSDLYKGKSSLCILLRFSQKYLRKMTNYWVKKFTIWKLKSIWLSLLSQLLLIYLIQFSPRLHSTKEMTTIKTCVSL